MSPHRSVSKKTKNHAPSFQRAVGKKVEQSSWDQRALLPGYQKLVREGKLRNQGHGPTLDEILAEIKDDTLA